MTPAHANAVSELHAAGIFLFLVGMVWIAGWLVISDRDRRKR